MLLVGLGLIGVGALISLASLLQGLVTNVHLTNTEGHAWLEMVARPLITLGLLGFVVSVAAAVALLRWGRSQNVLMVGIASLSFLLAGGAGVAGRVLYNEGRNPWPTYHRALASFPSPGNFHEVAR